MAHPRGSVDEQRTSRGDATLSVWLLLAGVALAAAIPLTVLAAFTLRSVAAGVRDDARNEVTGIARLIASRVEDYIHEQRTVLTVTAMTVGMDGGTIESRDRVLQRVGDQLPPYIRNVGIYTPAGLNIGHAHRYLPSETRATIADRLYFRSALATKRFAVGEPVTSRITGKRVAGTALPLLSPSGEVASIVTTSSELDHLLDMLNLPQLPENSVVAIIDTTGTIVTRNLDPERWVGRMMRDHPAVQTVLKNRTGSGEFANLDGVRRFGAYLPAKDVPWFVFVGVPSSSVAGLQREHVMRSAILASLVLLAALLLAALFARRIGQPITLLTADARALGAGDANRRANTRRAGPLRPLASAFNGMADELSARRSELEQAEAKYRFMFEQNPGAMWVFDDASLQVLAVNDAAIERYGYSREEFLRMSIADIRPAEDLALLHFSRLQSEEKRVHSELPYRHVKKDGGIMLVSVTANPIQFDGRASRLVLADDVTERVGAERALRISEEQYRLVTDGIPLLIGDVSGNGQLRFSNRAFTTFFGKSRDELTGVRFAELFPADVQALLRSRTRSTTDGSAVVFETTLRRADGVEARCMVSLVPRATGEPARDDGYFVVISDVSERVELETQLRHSQKLEAVGQLAGGVAHDFNNLLTVILSHATFAREEVSARPELASVSEGLSESLAEITNAGERAAALTRQLLAFSRRQPLASRVIDLNSLTLGVDRMLRRLLGEDIEMVTLLAPAIGAAEADPGQIEQILVNLAVNARDAMPNGGRLTIETANVALDAEYAATRADVEPGEYVMLAVSDTGTGMSAETLERVFEPFFTTKAAGQGTGLGLAVCYGIAKQHGGHLSAYSQPGEGSTFRLYLPRVARAAEPAAAKVVHAASRGTELVLLVEDTFAVRTVAARALVSHGYEVVSAADGEEALRMIAAMERPVDLLLTDLMMPRMGGREIAERLREQVPDLRVLFMSGYTQQAASSLASLGDSVHYLPKPFVPSDLLRKVREVLDTA